MVLSFKDLQDRVMRVLDETATNAPTSLTLVKDFLNQSHQQRCTEFPWNFMLWPKVSTFSTVIGQKTYALHEEFHRPLYFRNRTTTKYLAEIPFRAIVESAGDWNRTTSPATSDQFMFLGHQGVSAQPAAASTVTIVSSSVSDTAVTVIINGELATGLVVQETLTINGTTSVAGSTSFQNIIDVTKTGTWVGTLSVSLTTDAITVLSLPPAIQGKQYKTIFIPDPVSVAEVIEYRFYRQPKPLVNDYDIPLIPAPHSGILVYDTLIKLSAYLTDTGGQTLRIWQSEAQQAQMSLYQTYANESQTLGAGATFINDTSNDGEWFPRVTR